MHTSTSIHISEPCNVAGDQFTPLTTGSYCHSCEKQVVDYTNMSDRELIHALQQNPSGCGSFRKDQLDRPLIENELVRRGYSLAAIALLLALQLCSLEVSGQTISPNAHIKITSAVTSKTSADQGQAKDLTIRELNVIDGEGYPLSYATIAILNSDSLIIGGEATDSTGTAFLKLTEEAVSLRVSFIGYQHQELLLKELEENLIELRPLSSRLAQATVIAYQKPNISGGFSRGGAHWIINKDEEKDQGFPADPTTKLKLYPNPSSGQTTLKSELLKEAILLNVYSAVGQLVMSVPLVDDTTLTKRIQLNDRLPSGKYIVELVLKNGTTEVIKWMVAR